MSFDDKHECLLTTTTTLQFFKGMIERVGLSRKEKQWNCLLFSDDMIARNINEKKITAIDQTFVKLTVTGSITYNSSLRD